MKSNFFSDNGGAGFVYLRDKIIKPRFYWDIGSAVFIAS
jgi:hypothetical protein